MFGQQTYSQQQFSEQQFGQQQFTGGFNTSQEGNTDNMTQQPPWLMSLGGSPAAFDFPSSPQSPDAASDHSHFSSFSSQATNTPNTSYASSACASDTRDCSPAPLFANAFRATALDPSTPSNNNNNNNSQPTGFPTPPPTQQPGSRFLPPTFNPCSQCSTPLPVSHHRPLRACGHAICPPCMRTLFIRALRTAAGGAPFSEPRCCPASILPLAAAGPVLNHFEFVAYRERIVESSMPPDERLYCYEERCGMYLRVLPGRRSGFCPLCEERTCTLCGRRSHRGGCAPGTDFKTGEGCTPWIAED